VAGFTFASIGAVAAAGYLLLPLVVRGFIRGLELTVNAFVWFAASLSAGADAWTIVSTVARAVATALLSPQAFIAVGGLVLIGAAALYGLQRLLGAEEKSSSK
jgi:hypothetical protein